MRWASPDRPHLPQLRLVSKEIREALGGKERLPQANRGSSAPGTHPSSQQRQTGAQIQPLAVTLKCRELTVVLQVFAPQVGVGSSNRKARLAETSLCLLPG